MPIIKAIENIAAPSIENPLHSETLSDAIAATDREKELCAKPWLSLTESWELAKLRGYSSTEESFNKNFDAQKLGSKYGIAKLPDKQKLQKLDKSGVERTYNVRVYKDTKTHT